MNYNLVIIRVDGGIASQIAFIALGMVFEEKGYRVKYDLSWFEYDGKGFYGVEKGYDSNYDVTFDMPKAFPKLSFEIATKEEREYYKTHYFEDKDNIAEFVPPLYVGGYAGRHYDIYFRDTFIKHFMPQEASATNTPFSKLLQEILETKSCGIHVRRGDLADNHIIYGEPTSLAYFSRVIQLVLLLEPEARFYLFSDDIQWTKEHIAPLIPDNRYRICDINTPQQGYLDLYLLSRCQIIVGSHGSMGSYAKILSPHNALFISPKINRVFHEMENVMFVNWGNTPCPTKPNKATLPPPPPQLNFRNKARLYVYRYLKSKLLHKGILNDTFS